MRGSRGGDRGSGPPEKSQKYRFSWNSRKFSKLWSQHSMWTIICTPAKRHLNGVSLAGRHWSTFSGIWIRSPGLKLLSVLRSWTPSDKTFWIRAWKESVYRWSDANPTVALCWIRISSVSECVDQACRKMCLFIRAKWSLKRFFASKAPNYEGSNLCAD